MKVLSFLCTKWMGNCEAMTSSTRSFAYSYQLVKKCFLKICETSKCHNFLIFQPIFIRFSPFYSQMFTLSYEIKLNLFRTSPLKTHIRDKWVSGTETNSSSLIPISFRCAISLNVDWADPTGKRTISKFERSPQTCLGPQAVFACPLNPLNPHSAKRRMEINLGGHLRKSYNLRAADELMTTVRL